MDMRFYIPKLRDSKILAFADVTVAEGIVVKGFRVIDGEKGRFAAVPSRSYMVDGSPRFVNQVIFTTTEMRERFLSDLLEAYELWRQRGAQDEAVPF